MFLAGFLAYELGWKGKTVAQMRDDLAGLLQLPAPAAQPPETIANPVATGAQQATSAGNAAGLGGSLIGQQILNALGLSALGLSGGTQPAPAASGGALVQP